MAVLTQKELAQLDEILDTEAAYYEKFKCYADEAQESAVRKLCEQLTDRSREHFGAVLSQLDAGAGEQLH